MEKENKKTKRSIKKPKFIVFTDKDGTLDLEDEQLSNIITLITAMEGMVIPITGRTVGDIEEDFRKRKIVLPPIIVGDNGANVYATSAKRFIIKKNLDNEKVKKIIEFYIQNGGNPDLIRYTDGSNIYASNTEKVKEYYRNNKTAKISEDLETKIKDSKDLTKITLAGDKENMQKVSEYADKLGFWTDMDKTKFPKKEENNYRLDIADKDINKGNAVKGIVEYLKPQYGYMCVGNGNNDISMFKQAIDDGMIVAIMEDASKEIIHEITEYAKKKKRGKIIIVPEDRNKANRLIYKKAKVFQTYIRSNQFNVKKNRLPNLERIKIKPLTHRVENKRHTRNKGDYER